MLRPKMYSEMAENGHLKLSWPDAGHLFFTALILWRLRLFHGLRRTGRMVYSSGDIILPDLVGPGVRLMTGWDDWSGYYLLSEDEAGGQAASSGSPVPPLRELSSVGRASEFRGHLEPPHRSRGRPAVHPTSPRSGRPGVPKSAPRRGWQDSTVSETGSSSASLPRWSSRNAPQPRLSNRVRGHQGEGGHRPGADHPSLARPAARQPPPAPAQFLRVGPHSGVGGSQGAVLDESRKGGLVSESGEPADKSIPSSFPRMGPRSGRKG